ncbi:MAG: alpha/beta fold hydrolase [Desulfuromonas sp.]|nr:alpha/beta fold hydrolase [Desulfuromonas sp.]
MQPYCPPIYLRSGHLQTIYPPLFRKISQPPYSRERITTPDNDFIDLDWSTVGSRTLAIVSHGLEGNSTRSYITGMVKALNEAGIDALAWNYRGCSGEPNRQRIMYHNGATYDLDSVVRHAIATGRYERVFLIGFSMGGNLTLLYAGEQGKRIHPLISGAITFSVPCDLSHSSQALTHPACVIYMKRFLLELQQKVKAKMALYPAEITDDGYHQIKNFKQFDDRYTAPLHNFKSAEDYWQKCSCNRLLHSIAIPSLIVNALDDPFLINECYPYELVKENQKIRMETPRHGGHVGFMLRGGTYWSEQRALQFIVSSR